ncbi:MAG: aminopeptidase P family protein [Muribaculaceae bacterium]|nr:aminopeptidase P family protein [Muribaculaceae bacterium]
MNESASRLAALRAEMKRAGIDAAIIPQADPHMGEYLASHWQVRRWLSGFNGSAGTLVVPASAPAMLWTDSRYFLQAARQLEGTEILLMKEGVPGTPSIEEWLAANLEGGATVGVDAMLFSTGALRSLRKALKARDIRLETTFDPVDALWPDRPALPKCEVFVHDEKYAGRAASAKIADALEAARMHGADALFVSALDQVAWLLNIRSRDVRYNPVATSYVYLGPEGNVLFIDPDKITPGVDAYLKAQGVETRPYTAVRSFIFGLSTQRRVLLDPASTAYGILEAFGDRAVEAASPLAMPKACKNEVQIEGIRSAMRRDGVALVHSLMELESRMAAGETLTELDVAEILRRRRGEQPLFFDESFGTIAGYGPHGAIVHYEADEESNATLQPAGLLLIDSGAQYLDGTTDITRTICLGEPTQQERSDFTLVMKGHIALARAVFPEGTCGTQLDALARQYLWQHGLSYLHGTGHGVGHFLNVHEGPQSVRLNYVPAPLTPGMVTSNEPGLYRAGIHGIRCENLVLCVPALDTEFGRFYKFETLTLFPFDTRLFATEMMTESELEWVNNYNARVYDTLAPELDTAAREWLAAKTQAI